MDFRHLLGTWKISNATIFDSHLILIFLLVLVLLVLLFSVRGFFLSLNHNSKTLIVRFSSLTILALMSSFMLQFVTRNFVNQENPSKFLIINNIDVLIAFLFGFTTLLGRHKFARAILPLLLVFGGMRLINNPSIEMDNLENITISLSMLLAVLVFIVVNKNLTVREMIIGQVITIFLIIYSFIFNSAAGTRFSTMSISNVSQNPVYNWIVSDTAKIVLFLVITTSIELIAWAVLRISTHYVQNNSLLFAFKTLFYVDETSIKKFIQNAWDYLAKKEIWEVEEFRETTVELAKSEKEEEVVLVDTPEYYMDFLLPSLVTVTTKVNSIRAPSR